MNGPTLDQSSQTLHLCWTQADPVSLTGVVQGGAGWAGTYVIESETAAITEMTATVTVGTWNDTAKTFTAGAGTDAQLAVTLSSAMSATIPAGVYGWRLQQVGGVTRLSGSVQVVAR